MGVDVDREAPGEIMVIFRHEGGPEFAGVAIVDGMAVLVEMLTEEYFALGRDRAARTAFLDAKVLREAALVGRGHD